MQQDEIEQSLRAVGFLSPLLGDLGKVYRQQHGALFEVSDTLNLIGQRQLLRGCEKAVAVGTLDPVNIGTRLLIRTMSNFQGALILIERGMSVEAQTLIRSCHENAFWIGAFVRDPAAALNEFKLDERKSQDSRADAYQRIIDQIEDDELRAGFKSLLANRPQKTQGRAIGLEALSILGGMHPNYAFYRQLSADSAHPSLHAIDRYLDKNDQGDWIDGFVIGPDNDGIRPALTMACQALITALAAFGELLAERSTEDHELAAVYERYKEIEGIATTR